MTITVYYGEKTNCPVLEPSNVFKQFISTQKNDETMAGLYMCPASKNFYKNTFSVKNIHQWTLIRDNDEFYSDTCDVNTFDRYFFLRNKKVAFFSMLMPELFIVPDKSVDIELIQPSLSDGDINLKTVITPGKFNPYNHIRSLELPFYFKSNKDKINCKRDEDLYYIKFCTDEKIIFKRFIVTDDFCKLTDNNLKNRDFNDIPLPLKWWYEKNQLVKLRQRVMKHIKDNLCD